MSFCNKGKLRICYVVAGFWPHHRGGGIVTYVYSIAKALIERGHRVIVLSLNRNCSYDWHLHDNISIYSIPEVGINRKNLLIGNLINCLRVAKALGHLIKSEKVKIVESPDIGAYSLFFYKLPICNVVRLHTSTAQLYFWRNKKIIDPRLKLFCYLERLSILKADFISVTTNFAANHAQTFFKINNKHLSVLPNLLILPEINPKANKNGFLKVVYIGRIEKSKGAHILAQAIPRIIEKCPQLSFEFIGSDTKEGPNKSSMIEHCRSLISPKYHKFVSFTGFIDHSKVLEKLSQSSVLAFPTYFEAFPMTLIESMMLGIPIVASKVCGIPEVIEHGVTGLLVPPGNPIALAEAIIYLLKNNEYREMLGANAKKVAFEKYSTTNGITLYEDFYQKILNGKN